MAGSRTCPRCKGTLMVEGDHHGWYEQCLQCGYHRDMEPADDLPEPENSVTETLKG